MKKDIIKEIVKVLSKRYKNKTVNIIFSGGIETVVKIHNFRYYISQDTTILSDEKANQLKIDNYLIENVEINNDTIILTMSSDYTIIIDC